jgi:hypothetical protein
MMMNISTRKHIERKRDGEIGICIKAMHINELSYARACTLKLFAAIISAILLLASEQGP